MKTNTVVIGNAFFASSLKKSLEEKGVECVCLSTISADAPHETMLFPRWAEKNTGNFILKNFPGLDVLDSNSLPKVIKKGSWSSFKPEIRKGELTPMTLLESFHFIPSTWNFLGGYLDKNLSQPPKISLEKKEILAENREISFERLILLGNADWYPEIQNTLSKKQALIHGSQGNKPKTITLLAWTFESEKQLFEFQNMGVLSFKYKDDLFTAFCEQLPVERKVFLRWSMVLPEWMEGNYEEISKCLKNLKKECYKELSFTSTEIKNEKVRYQPFPSGYFYPFHLHDFQILEDVFYGGPEVSIINGPKTELDTWVSNYEHLEHQLLGSFNREIPPPVVEFSSI
jgi:hypothetical protein